MRSLQIMTYPIRLIRSESAPYRARLWRSAAERKHFVREYEAMKLNIGGYREIQDPSELQIRDALRELDEIESFLILEADRTTYVQCSGDSSVGFDREFQEGSIDHHYRSKKRIDAETVLAKFAVYAAGGKDWREGVQWEKLTL